MANCSTALLFFSIFSFSTPMKFHLPAVSGEIVRCIDDNLYYKLVDKSYASEDMYYFPNDLDGAGYPGSVASC